MPKRKRLMLHEKPASRPKTILQWLAPGLVRAGLLRNAEWVPAAADAVKAMEFQGALSQCATILAVVHPLGLEYLRQCPALADLAFKDPHKTSQRMAAARQWKSEIDKRPKLRDLMATFDVPPVMRWVPAAALCARGDWAPGYMAALSPSTFKQSMPTDPVLRKVWAETILELSAILRLTFARAPAAPALSIHADQLSVGLLSISQAEAQLSVDLLTWFVKRLPRDREMAMTYSHEGGNIIRGILDYAVAAGFSAEASWDRVVEASRAWHDRTQFNEAEAYYRQHGLAFDAEIDYGRFPLECSIDDLVLDTTKLEKARPGLRLVALRTGRALTEESMAMKHCVWSYGPRIAAGLSRIYSIRDGDERLSTVEYDQRGVIAQHSGPRNARPPLDAALVAAAFSRKMVGTEKSPRPKWGTPTAGLVSVSMDAHAREATIIYAYNETPNAVPETAP